MATTTTRLGLTKPATSDNVDVTVLDTNFDQLDLKMCTQVCTSATRPSAPFQGQLIYETDTLYVRVWSGTTWVPIAVSGSAVTSTTRPASPVAGQLIYETDSKLSFVYNGAAWVPVPAGAFACTSSTHPTDPGAGSLIYETDTGSTLVYSGTTWVPVLNTGGPAVVGATGSTAALRIQTTSTLTNRAVGLRKSTDAQDAYTVDFSGKTQWGPGGAGTQDTNLYRSATGTLTTDGNLVVGGRITGITCYSQGATGPLTLNTTETDVPGATITFSTTKANTTATIEAVFDVTGSGSSNTSTVTGRCSVDGVIQTAEAHYAMGNALSGKGSPGQNWTVVFVSAGSHTVKLRALAGNATNPFQLAATHTNLSVTVFDI